MESPGEKGTERMNASRMPFGRFQVVLLIAATVYLAVLPMADTIALRNVALMLLLVGFGMTWKDWIDELVLPKTFLLWTAYLIVYPLIAGDTAVAVKSLVEQWIRGPLAFFVGACTAIIIHPTKFGKAFWLGLVSATTIFVHLAILTWQGFQLGTVPWQSWGRESHHADLGYAACQTIVIMIAAWNAGNRNLRPWALLIVALCLVSVGIAGSRAGFAFGLLGGVLAFGCIAFARSVVRPVQVFVGLGFVVAVAGLVLDKAIEVDPRWKSMLPQLTAGLLGNALDIQCNGTQVVEAEVQQHFGSKLPIPPILDSIRVGDGSRVVLLRAGVALALKHPWGIDGSRQSYKKALRMECSVPAIEMAHAHDGWIDTSLAIGWLGGILYFAFFAACTWIGWATLKESPGEWPLILLVLPIFWSLRAFADSVFRDHMFEMQSFVIAFSMHRIYMLKKHPEFA